MDPNKLRAPYIKGWRGLPGTNTIEYRVHM